jgi:hypothetical protein
MANKSALQCESKFSIISNQALCSTTLFADCFVNVHDACRDQIAPCARLRQNSKVRDPHLDQSTPAFNKFIRHVCYFGFYSILMYSFQSSTIGGDGAKEKKANSLPGGEIFSFCVSCVIIMRMHFSEGGVTLKGSQSFKEKRATSVPGRVSLQVGNLLSIQFRLMIAVKSNIDVDQFYYCPKPLSLKKVFTFLTYLLLNFQVSHSSGALPRSSSPM